ncbi:MAG: acyl-CoA thioesterase [Bacteroidia bacterium]
MLSNTIEIPIRFSEVDSLRVVWHGHYIKFFEDGREAFGKEFGFSYLDIFNSEGLAVPIVDISLQYKRPLEYGDSAIVETNFINTPAAKIIFEYTIYSAAHKYVACTGKSVQVFTDPVKKELCITNPAFYEDWKKKNGLTV